MQASSKRLAGKVAVVTGASKGIGAAIARRLAAEGAAVVVNYASSHADGERVVAQIVKEGGKALALQSDVARAGKRAEFEAWVRELLAIAAHAAELEGSSVLTAGDGEHFVLLRFANARELERFESAREVVGHLARGEALATSVEPLARREGLETWFALPGLPTQARPPATWKMALVTWLALLPQVIALSFVVPRSLPFLAQVALSTAIPVVVLAWVIMPRATRLLARWLYPTLDASPLAASTQRTPVKLR